MIEPKRTIPRAIIATFVVTAILYMLVAVAAIRAVGADRFAGAPGARVTPLEVAGRSLGQPTLAFSSHSVA